MNKLKKILFVFILIVCMTYSFSLAESNFISVSSQSVGQNSEFYLILNLSNIPYNKFKVEITNSSKLKPTDLTSRAVDSLSAGAGNTSFVVNKADINLDKLGIVYTAGKPGDVINFQVSITSLDNTVQEMQLRVNNLIKEIDGLNLQLVELQKKLPVVAPASVPDTDSDTTEENDSEDILEQINIIKDTITSKQNEKDVLQDKILNYTEEKITESTQVEVVNSNNVMNNPNLENNQMQKEPFGNELDSMMKDKMKEMDRENEKMSMNMKDMMFKMTNLESDLNHANNRISELTQSNVYQGSQNNYLKSLSISNVEFNSEFKKTTLNYFANVSKETSSVTVNAVAEESSAIVSVYGNTDLKEGKNRIIVSVTAEDGSVRNYKIYVMK